MESLSINGFVRSGTTLFHNVIQVAFPKTTIIPYNHRIKEIGLDSNGAVIIREPAKCVSSWIVYDNQPQTQESVDNALEWFISFFTKLVDNKNSVHIVKFDDFVVNPNAVARAIAVRFGLSNRIDIDVDAVFANVAELFPRNSPDWSDEPFDSVEELVRSSSLYGEAVSLFNQL